MAALGNKCATNSWAEVQVFAELRLNQTRRNAAPPASEQATWLYTPKGRYGFTDRVPVVVVNDRGNSKVTVRAPLERGGFKKTSVSRQRLEFAPWSESQLAAWNRAAEKGAQA